MLIEKANPLIKVASIYEDVKDNVNTPENGRLSYPMFNRMSRRGELAFLGFLTGDISGLVPPEPYLTQKNKDWLAPFIETDEGSIQDGSFGRPEDYYGFENMVLLTNKNENCDNEKVDIGYTPITLLDGPVFNQRLSTDIEELKPENLPICKLTGKGFVFAPYDAGSVRLEYYRYPKFAQIVYKEDPVYLDEVIDEEKSTNYEWDEYARELLVWFITESFGTHMRDLPLKQHNVPAENKIRKS